MVIHEHPIDIPADYYKPLGKIVAGWNLTEALISSIIWHLHGISNPKIGRLFTYKHNSEDKLRIFKETAEKYLPDQSSITTVNMLRLYKKADELRIKRNRFAHGPWGRMPGTETWKVFYLNSAKETHLLKREEVTVPKLEELATDVQTLNKDLYAFIHENGIDSP
jgi:hypothetical protein